jgi:serine/threonine-protein kinase
MGGAEGQGGEGHRADGQDERLFAALDAYVEDLHAGRKPDRARLLAEHPELAATFACVDALEGFLPLEGRAAPAGETPTPEPAVTIATPDLTAGVGGTARPACHPPDAIDLRAGFGEYDLLDELGRGGMGVVYRARQRSLDRIVAVKMILASHLASEDQVRRFQGEARAAAGVSHPHVVRVFEVGQVHGQHYFTMEHVAGRSLADRLAAGPLEPEAAVRLLLPVVRAVEHLHRHGIVHRDLKPSNILLDEEGRPYVTDFGLAKMFVGSTRQTANGLIAGTPSYMAPEQAAGKNDEVGPLADVYSLGAILFELVCGRPPFAEENPLDTLLQVLEREPPAPRQLAPHVPRMLELVIQKCLAKSAATRYASAAALAEELERFLAGDSLAVQPPGLGQRTWRWAQRVPALATRIAAFTIFYALELVNYHVFGTLTPGVHYFITAVVVVWLAASFAFEHLIRRPGWANPARFAWAALDASALTAVLLAAHGATSSMLIGYLLLVVSSGLWFQRRLVWFMTAACVAGYGLLVFDFYFHRPELQEEYVVGPMRHLDFSVALIIAGAITAHQVERMRALSRYYERWRRE